MEDGLLDSHVQAIGQDKYGYMWFGTLSGLSVYDGRQLKHHIHRADDTTSILSEMVMSIKTDKNGRLFIGFVNGLVEYDFKTGRFRRIAAAKGKNIYRIFPIEKDLIFITTTEGVAQFNPNTEDFHFLEDPLLKTRFWGGYFSKGKLYLGADKGLIIYDIQTKKATKAPIPSLENTTVYSVLIDEKTVFGSLRKANTTFYEYPPILRPQKRMTIMCK